MRQMANGRKNPIGRVEMRSESVKTHRTDDQIHPIGVKTYANLRCPWSFQERVVGASEK
jgi:hypothetical protein